ncbi:MAG: glycosyltransferase family 4 protein [Verrucomicrobiota bacterium]
MSKHNFTIGFVRRGFSASGGAEAYLKRLAEGVVNAGHVAHLFTTRAWPEEEWTWGPITHLRESSAIAFADELERLRGEASCHVWMSLDRIWRCDVFRAGDGVHRAWLERRKEFATAWQKFARVLNGKHRDLLCLEDALLGKGGASRVIANSRMVADEITRIYGYPSSKIDVVHNGVPVAAFRPNVQRRATERAGLGLNAEDIALLFVGSGWERKGLRFALDALEASGSSKVRLFVAGRGNQRKYKSSCAYFLGVVHDLRAVYAAADIFILPTLYDPFSNASLEALAAGLPVITTRANGMSEVIEDGIHGSVLNDPRDLRALVDAIQTWTNTARRAEAQPHILARAAQFDISINVARTLEILLHAANAASTSGKSRNT